MADDMNNDELEQGAASEGMPEDLKRLLARANEDDASAYDPDAESDEDEDDDEELEESFGANDRGEDAGTDAVSYTHLTLPTMASVCRSRWSPYH